MWENNLEHVFIDIGGWYLFRKRTLKTISSSFCLIAFLVLVFGGTIPADRDHSYSYQLRLTSCRNIFNTFMNTKPYSSKPCSRQHIASQFKFVYTYRYIDDVLSVNILTVMITFLKSILMKSRPRRQLRAAYPPRTWIYIYFYLSVLTVTPTPHCMINVTIVTLETV